MFLAQGGDGGVSNRADNWTHQRSEQGWIEITFPLPRSPAGMTPEPTPDQPTKPLPNLSHWRLFGVKWRERSCTLRFGSPLGVAAALKYLICSPRLFAVVMICRFCPSLFILIVSSPHIVLCFTSCFCFPLFYCHPLILSPVSL